MEFDEEFAEDVFEVSLDDELLHSRLTRAECGDGCCETEEEVAVLIARINSALSGAPPPLSA